MTLMTLESQIAALLQAEITDSNEIGRSYWQGLVLGDKKTIQNEMF